MDSKDPDAKPLPVTKMMVHHLLYYTPGRVDRRPGRLPRRRVPRRARGGAPERAVRRRSGRRSSARATASATRRPTARAPAWTLTAMVMNHYKQPKRFYVRTKHLVHDRAAHAALPDDGRRLPPPRQRHGLRRAGRRQAGLDVRRPLDLDGAVQRAHPRRRLAPPRRRDCTRRCVSKTCGRTLFDAQGLLRRRRPPVQHDPPDPARARADRQRHVPDRRRASRSAPGEVLERAAVHANVEAARGGDGLLGPAARPRRHA